MNWSFWLWVIATVLVVAGPAFIAHKLHRGEVPKGFKGNREEFVSKFRSSYLRSSVLFLVLGGFMAGAHFFGFLSSGRAPDKSVSASEVAKFVFIGAGVGSPLLAYWYLRTAGSPPATPAADPEGPAQPNDI